MNTTNDYPQDAPVLRQASRKRSLIAFLVTSLAAFLMIGLTWPLTMKGYQSEGLIEFENQQVASTLVNNDLPTALRSALHPTAMRNRLEQMGTDSSRLNAGNVEELHRRISVGFRDGSSTQKPSLRVVLVGKGTADEARFIESFVSDLAMRLEVAAVAITRADGTARTPSRPVYQAQWLVNQIEEGLTSAKTQTAHLMAHNSAHYGASTFRNVGHVKEQATTGMDSLHRTLESVDVSSLRGVIEQLEKNGVQQSTGLVRFDANRIASRPVGAVPNAASLMLAGLVSMILGGVVAWNLQPFADQGFESVDDVANQLGVPVVGTLNVDPPAIVDVEQPLLNLWANRAVRLSGTVLAAIAILGVGFWLTSAEVRDSFGESWFHGFARIVWKLSGS